MEENRIEYRGKLGKIYLIWLHNMILTSITLGVYHFWAKTKMRKYLASNVYLDGDRFEFTGNGKELFIGFLKSLPFIIALFSVPFFFGEPEEFTIADLVYFTIFYYFISYALYSSLKYKYSRLTWRGVRGRLIGSSNDYAVLKFEKLFFTIITLGYFIPKEDVQLYKFITNNSRYGSSELKFNGNHKPLMKINIITLLLAIPTLGFSRIWYKANLIKYVKEHTKVDDIQIKSDITPGKYFKHIFINILLFVFTLGIGVPIIIHRNTRFLTEKTYLVGDLDTRLTRQMNKDDESAGDSMADFLEVDFGVF